MANYTNNANDSHHW